MFAAEHGCSEVSSFARVAPESMTSACIANGFTSLTSPAHGSATLRPPTWVGYPQTSHVGRLRSDLPRGSAALRTRRSAERCRTCRRFPRSPNADRRRSWRVLRLNLSYSARRAARVSVRTTAEASKFYSAAKVLSTSRVRDHGARLAGSRARKHRATGACRTLGQRRLFEAAQVMDVEESISALLVLPGRLCSSRSSGPFDSTLTAASFSLELRVGAARRSLRTSVSRARPPTGAWHADGPLPASGPARRGRAGRARVQRGRHTSLSSSGV